MKLLVITLLIFFMQPVSGQLFVSPVQPPVDTSRIIQPVANQIAYLWQRHSGCYTNDYDVEPQTQVSYEDQEVRVFYRAGLGGSTFCVTPPPRSFVLKAEIHGLMAGDYTLNTYHVPFNDIFPPMPDDYPQYFQQSVDFSVRGQPTAVDTNSQFGLLIMAVLMWLVAWKTGLMACLKTPRT